MTDELYRSSPKATTAINSTHCDSSEHLPPDEPGEHRTHRSVVSSTACATPDMSIVRDEFHAPTFPTKILREAGQLAQDLAEAIGADIGYVVGPMFAASSACIGNSRAVRVGSLWVLAATWWHTSIGEPSTGKSPAQQLTTSPLVEIDRERRRTHQKKREQAFAAQQQARVHEQVWRAECRKALQNGETPPPMPRGAQVEDQPGPFKMVAADVTTRALEEICLVNPRGVLLRRDESRGFLNELSRTSSPLGPLMLSAFSGADHDVSRAGGKSLVIPRLNVSLSALITPDDWKSHLVRHNDGLLARICAIHPKPVGLPAVDRIVDLVRLERMYCRLLSLKLTLRGGVPKPKELPLSVDALVLHREWHRDHHEGQEGGYLGAHFGKLPGIALRLALLLELIWWAYGEGEQEPQAVTEAAMNAALGAIDDYYKPMARRVYGVSGVSPEEGSVRLLAEHILKHRLSVINARTISRSARLPGLRTTAAVLEAAKHLQNLGWVDPIPYRGAGRPADSFDVNPIVFAMEQGA